MIFHLSALPVPLLRQVPLFGHVWCLFFRVLFGCPKGSKRVPKMVKNRSNRGSEMVLGTGYQKSSQTVDFRDPPM